MPHLEGLGPYFKRLPAELRIKIYGYLAPREPITAYPIPDSKGTSDPLELHHKGAILLVSRIIRNEALDVIYNGTTFRYDLIFDNKDPRGLLFADYGTSGIPPLPLP